MANKKINFDTFMLSTDKHRVFKRETVYTNDKNSAELNFNVKDIEDLTSYTPNILLYMRDGSFFQITDQALITVEGTTVKYALKDNEGKHGGLARTQLVLIAGESELASAKFEFNIESGLGGVASEVMIQDWSTLLKTARDYIDDFIDGEAARQTEFESNEAARQSLYDDLVNTGVLQSNIDTKLAELEEEYAPAFANVTAQLAQTAKEVKEVPIAINKEINSGIATNNISNGGGFQRKPAVAITFDDGYLNDYTLMKSVMDEFGVKGTLYINTGVTGIPGEKISENHIKQFHDEGWEIGSHGDNHSTLGEVTLNKDISIGDTTIEIANGGTNPMIKAFPEGTKLRLRNSARTVFGQVVANDYNLNAGVLTLNLSEPINFDLPRPAVVSLHEEAIIKEVRAPKEYLSKIGINATGYAYPWGAITDTSKRVVQSQFSYARLASSGNAGTTGGLLDGDEIPVKQFSLPCSELPNLTDSAMDVLIAKVISENGLLIVLGHTNGWGALEPKLRTFISKVQTAGVDIMPLNEALLYHGNTAELGDFSVSKNGTTVSGGVNILPRKFATATSNLDIYPLGVSTMRVVSADSAGFPTSAGTAVTYKTKKSSIGFWTWQYWHDQLTNDVYYRNSTGATTFLPWEKQAKYSKYPQVDLGTFNIPANSYVDKELVGVVVDNNSVIAVSGYTFPLGKNIFYMSYVASAKAYIRITNPMAEDLETRHRFSVAVFD